MVLTTKLKERHEEKWKCLTLKRRLPTLNASCEENGSDFFCDLDHDPENASGPCPVAAAHAPVMPSENAVSLQEKRNQCRRKERNGLERVPKHSSFVPQALYELFVSFCRDDAHADVYDVSFAHASSSELLTSSRRSSTPTAAHFLSNADEWTNI